MVEEFKLYVIISEYNMKQIPVFLKPYTSNGSQIGSIRKDFNRIKDGDEIIYVDSGKKYILLNTKVYDKLKNAGYSDVKNKSFYIFEYDIKPSDKSPKDSVPHFYFPHDSKDINYIDIINKMEFIDETGIIQREDYHIHRGIVEFSPKVDEETRCIIKKAIDDVKCRVSWCKKFAFKNIDFFYS